MKKKLVAGIVSVCLIAAMGVGATFAYYTSTTDEVKNTFTVGNVKIELLEPDWIPDKGLTLYPGAAVAKNPFITNVGAGAGYMMLKVDGMEEMSKMGFSVKNGEADGYNYDKWILVDELTGEPKEAPADHSLVDGYYIYAKGEVAPADQTEPLFTSVMLAEDAKETSAAAYQIVAKYQDETTKDFFTYKDLDGNVIEANKNLIPAKNADGKVIIKYFIENDACADAAGYDNYDDAEAHVLAEHKTEADCDFDLIVQGFAIQSENLEFKVGTDYPWVTELAK